MLRQIKASRGINRHRAWRDDYSGIVIESNDDIPSEYRFHIGHGEYYGMTWYKSPKEALKAAINNNNGQ